MNKLPVSSLIIGSGIICLAWGLNFGWFKKINLEEYYRLQFIVIGIGLIIAGVVGIIT
jgi:hypothetical protein